MSNGGTVKSKTTKFGTFVYTERKNGEKHFNGLKKCVIFKM